MIATRLTMICAAPTEGTRKAVFGDDMPVDPAGERKARELAARMSQADRALTSPALSARQTAELLGYTGEVEQSLRDCGYGRWQGRALEDIAATEAEGLMAWRNDPSAAPHGGESLLEVAARVSAWVDSRAKVSGHTIIVTHSTVIRAAIVHAIDAIPQSFWHIDIEPLSQTLLTHSNGIWRLRAIAP